MPAEEDEKNEEEEDGKEEGGEDNQRRREKKRCVSVWGRSWLGWNLDNHVVDWWGLRQGRFCHGFADEDRQEEGGLGLGER